jgi:hypothetical protein
MTFPLPYSPFDAALRTDPYPAFDSARAAGAYRLPSWQGGQWILTRYRDVRALIASNHFLVDDLPGQLESKAAAAQGVRVERLVRNLRSWLFFRDPPEHGAMRKLLQQRFSAARLAGLRETIGSEARDLLAAADEDAPFDVIGDYAHRLPGRVMRRILGMPADRLEELTAWSTDLFKVLVPPQSLPTYARLDATTAAFEDYFTALMALKKTDPGDDVITDLAADGVDPGTALGLAVMLFSVGQDTTENLIGNAVLALLRYPDQLEILREDPSLLGAAVDEAARFDTPVQGIARTCARSVVVGDETISAGERTIFMLAAANRDPEQFEDPDAFVIGRTVRSMLPFGGGAHFCLGAHLARLIAEEALGALIEHAPEMRLADQPLRWKNIILLRALTALPVRFEKTGVSGPARLVSAP